jgi:FlaG/FlaF family flagellin (archaellin)
MIHAVGSMSLANVNIGEMAGCFVYAVTNIDDVDFNMLNVSLNSQNVDGDINNINADSDYVQPAIAASGININHSQKYFLIIGKKKKQSKPCFRNR